MAKPQPELASGGVSRTPIGRADLVRALVRCGGQAGAASLERFASLAGFVRRPVVLLPRVPIAESQPAPPLPLPAETAPAEVAVAPSAVSWYAVVQMTETPPAPDGQPDNGPVCLRGVPPLTADDLLPEASAPLLPDSPLLPWARLWPFLKQTLGATTAGPIDVPRVAGLLAEGRVLRHLPRLCRSRWAPEAQVLVDFDLRLEPFRQDFNDLCAGLLRLRGPLGLQILRLLEEPGGAVRPWGQATAPDRPWRPPAPGAPVLLCSDLGMLAGRDSGLHAAWLRFGRLLNARGIRPWVLAPVSPERLSPAVLRHFEVVCFTPDAPLRPCHAPGAPREAAALAELLAFLAPAVRVEPALLRAAVRHLAPRAARAGVEAAFWNHPDFVQAHGGVAALPDAAHRTRAGFARLTPGLQRDAMALLHRAHAHLPPAVLHEERLTAAGLANPSALAAQGAQVDRSARFLLSAAASFHGETAQLADAKAAWARRLLDRGDAAQRSRHPAYSVLYAAAYRQALLDGAPAVPDDGLDRQEILRALADPTASPTRWDLVQDSHTLRLVPDWTPLDRAHLRVSLLARLRVTSPLVAVQTPGPHGGLTMQPLGMDPVHLTRLAPEGLPIKVSTGSVEIVVDAFPRPPWARAIGRDAEGLWCDAEWLGQRVRLRWGALEHAPHWGWQPKGGVGVDTFGLYADFTVAGVTQRCRWIAPGSFRMGSPPDEVNRSSNETQHDVTLTRGYWLADSACTQALWQAVMGANPSRFKADPANPVEQVSWNDVHTFLDRLNAQVPGLDAGLPSEAQWEYACRAGTTTPFSFGENITPEQVNYDGNRPYADGKKGLDRGQTVPVKSLPPNPWGLYEMHGNVYEWCADWFGDYGAAAQTDPSGPPEGVARVLRGGSWDHFGLLCRAADRNGLVPVVRGDNIGFRLAPGQRPGPAGREAARRADGQAQAERAGQAAGGDAGEEGMLRRVFKKLTGGKKKP